MNDILLDTNVLVYDIEIVSIMLANEIKKVATANIDDFKNVIEIELFEIS